MRIDLSKVQRQAPEKLLASLKSTSPAESAMAGSKLIAQAKDLGLSMKDFLTLAVDPHQSEKPQLYAGLNGFEATLAYLNLPFRDNFEHGVMLQAASDSFQTYPGTRAMFPEVVDQMLKFKTRQDNIENVAPLLAQSRTINGTELISMAIEDSDQDRGTQTIAEFGRIPVRTLRTSQTSVGIYKHGSGIRTSYEFERRASLDILTPFAARVARELEISKVKAATSILINGDGVNPAATAVSFTDFGGTVVGSKALSEQYKALAKFLVERAKNGTPVDTIVGNLDIYLELLFMFTPTLRGDKAEIEALTAKGAPSINLSIPLLNSSSNFVLSSSMPDNKILAYSKGDTLEELVEAGSSISENEKSIQNQSVVYVRSENTGYKIAMGDTRVILDLAS